MITKVFVRTVLLGGLLAGVSVLSAMAEGFLFSSTIIGSNPKIVIAGVPSGGAPWTVQSGSAALSDDGLLSVQVQGLILPNLGNPGPVTSVSASLVCGGSGGTVVATTDPVPLFPNGDAKIQAGIKLTDSCFGPIVLVRAAGFNGNPPLPQSGPWIAATGFTISSAK
jgi:hypothetical protein